MSGNNLLQTVADEIAMLSAPADLSGLIRGIASESKTPCATKDEASQLRALQRRFEGLAAELERFSDAQVKTEWLARRAKLAAGSDESSDIGDRESVRCEFAARRQAIKAAMRDVSDLARPIAGVVLKRLADSAVGIADRLETEERRVAERFGAKFRQSLQVMALRDLPRIRNGLAGGGLCSPKAMLHGVCEI